jgi:hypothetical protein
MYKVSVEDSTAIHVQACSKFMTFATDGTAAAAREAVQGRAG